MSEGVPAASTRPSATLVELESELEALLIKYDELDSVGAKGHHVWSGREPAARPPPRFSA